jgi:hypothetical protein
VVLTLTPRLAPAADSNQRRLTVITWNCTGSDDAATLELIAELVWGPATAAAFADVVCIQEFSKVVKKRAADYRQLTDAFLANRWLYHKTDDEGDSPTSKRSYFVVWNDRRLEQTRRPVLIDDLTAPVVEPPPPPPRLDGRPSRDPKPRDFLDPAGLSDENNSPLTIEFRTRLRPNGVRLPLYLYTWHVSKDFADARLLAVPDPDDPPKGPLTRLRELELFAHRGRVAREMQSAIGEAGLFILAGDLNVEAPTLTQPLDLDEPRVLFPPGLGYKIASGGAGGRRVVKNWDHIIASFGNRLTLTRFEPGRVLGDHKPLGARLTV